MNDPKLFMILLGSYPPGRHTEQHDVFFSIGTSLKDLIPEVKAFWPEGTRLHIDGWREVNWVDEYKIEVKQKTQTPPANENDQLKIFFINLGGYKQDEFEEFHYKLLAVGKNSGEAIQRSKATAFYKHTGFEGASSHGFEGASSHVTPSTSPDDKYGIDVDDVYFINDVLPASIKEKYSILVTPSTSPGLDQVNLGYFKLDKILNSV